MEKSEPMIQHCVYMGMSTTRVCHDVMILTATLYIRTYSDFSYFCYCSTHLSSSTVEPVNRNFPQKKKHLLLDGYSLECKYGLASSHGIPKFSMLVRLNGENNAIFYYKNSCIS